MFLFLFYEFLLWELIRGMKSLNLTLRLLPFPWMSIEWHTRQDELGMCALEKKLNNTRSKKNWYNFLFWLVWRKQKVDHMECNPNG